MNAISNLILGHLVADFPLQTSSIFQWKTRSSMGVIAHAAIHLLVNAILFFPSLAQVWVVLVLLFVIHAAQDYIKVRLGGEKVNASIPFLFDQVLHFTLLGVISLVPPLSENPATWLQSGAAIYASGFVAATFTCSVLVYILAQNSRRERNDLEASVHRKEVDFLINGLLYGAIVTGLYYLAVPVILIKYALFKYQVGGGYYSFQLELGFVPLWAIAIGLLVQQVAAPSLLMTGFSL